MWGNREFGVKSGGLLLRVSARRRQAVDEPHPRPHRRQQARPVQPVPPARHLPAALKRRQQALRARADPPVAAAGSSRTATRSGSRSADAGSAPPGVQRMPAGFPIHNT